jgi:serine/threonine protein kinase
MPSGEGSSQHLKQSASDDAQQSLPRAGRPAHSHGSGLIEKPAPTAQPAQASQLSKPAQVSGRKLGQYTLLEKIGQGGMGSVFKAFDTALERTVALKVFFSSAIDNPKQAERFMREARGLARLNHPNLVHVYNVGIDSDCHYFAMELVEGETLTQMLRRLKRIPPADVLQIAGQVLAALHYVHKQGITHRDIKSGNIMVSRRRAVLMDFGLAKDDHYSGLTSDGSVLGTPDYMAPEQAEGQAVSPATDLYSFGIVLYEMLSGNVPFSGKSAISIIRQHIEVPPPPIDAKLPDIDPLLAECVHKCLAKKPADRYPHCGALAADLSKLSLSHDLQALAEETAEAEASGADGASPSRVQSRTQARTLVEPQATRPRAGGFDRTWIEPGVNSRTPRPGDATLTSESPVVRPHLTSALTVPDATAANGIVEDGVPAPAAARTQRPWLWVAAGFFGVIVLAIMLARPPRNSPQEPEGTAVRLHLKNGASEDVRLIEFKTGGVDPDTWLFIVNRQQADGSWKKETVKYSDAQADKALLEFVPETKKAAPESGADRDGGEASGKAQP